MGYLHITFWICDMELKALEKYNVLASGGRTILYECSPVFTF